MNRPYDAKNPLGFLRGDFVMQMVGISPHPFKHLSATCAYLD